MSEFNELQRDVWCILGLPFDTVDMQSSLDKVYESILEKKSCFISTPNLNFLVASQNQAEFRDSVIESNLSIADGMPLIWISRFLGFPIRERVPGSGLIEQLITKTDAPVHKVKVFFFGGIEGIAEQACSILNQQGGQLECVGTYYPGFGTVDDMSHKDIIDKVNTSNADFIIVSLGARKGQAWIMNNRHKLTAPVISHLGAVVNFIAGSVNRSPVWMQKTGLEWLWRIYQEPALWARYVKDGLAFIKLIVTRIIPYKIFLVFNKQSEINNQCSIDAIEVNDDVHLNFQGVFTCENIHLIRESFKEAVVSNQNIKINMRGVTYIDSSAIALIMILNKLIRKNDRAMSLISVPRRIKKIFSYNGAMFLLDVAPDRSLLAGKSNKKF